LGGPFSISIARYEQEEIVMDARRIRLIRKRKRQTETDSPAAAPNQPRPEPSEREIKTIVWRWVSDHRERSEEFRRTVAALLKGGQFHVPTR